MTLMMIKVCGYRSSTDQQSVWHGIKCTRERPHGTAVSSFALWEKSRVCYFCANQAQKSTLRRRSRTRRTKPVSLSGMVV